LYLAAPDDVAMPTVMRIGRFRFYFFSNESEEPPHIHVKAGSREAKYWLDPVELATNQGFRSHELNEIDDLVVQHRTDFLEAWNDHFGPP
jgi:hypothetical protein